MRAGRDLMGMRDLVCSLRQRDGKIPSLRTSRGTSNECCVAHGIDRRKANGSEICCWLFHASNKVGERVMGDRVE